MSVGNLFTSDEAQQLLSWYDAQQRQLPWRRNRDPYRVWLSEIMLQQTRAQAVIPYFERFVARFPTVDDLAAAPLEDVLALWSGLGYYRRARWLHRAAREVVARGDFPRTAEALEQLTGIGPYTAAAVASIAFGQKVPVLDGNVERVTARLLAIDESPKKSAVRRRLLAAAASLLDASRPGDSNQAMMELGAQICRPRSPLCSACPLTAACAAYLDGAPERFPPPRPRRRIERLDLALAIVVREGRLLLFKRPDGSDLLAGIWELPNVEMRPRRAAIEVALGERYGSRWELERPRGVVRHAITFRALHLHLHPARLAASSHVGEGPEAAWIDPRQWHQLPLSSMVEKAWLAFSQTS